MKGTPWHHARGDAVDLRYVLTDGRIEMCWPCRVVEDSEEIVALFIAAESKYRAGPKRTAAEKRAIPSPPLPSEEYVWRADTLRLMFPGRLHSVSLFWARGDEGSGFSRYFVNMEEPFRRTPIGFDTQDHTLDIVIQPDLSWAWRDENEFRNHVREGFFTEGLAEAVREEGIRVLDEISSGVHPCLGWTEWSPEKSWKPPVVSEQWATTPATFWDRRSWAYGVAD
jgi:hypothetical protein